MYNIKTIVSQCLSDARRRAKKKNLQFNIDADYLNSIFPKDFICPILGYLMVPGKNKSTNTSPSLDRINPSSGYVKGNVEFVCLLANRMMSNAHGPDLVRFAKWIDKRYKYKREDNYGKKYNVRPTQQLSFVFVE